MGYIYDRDSTGGFRRSNTYRSRGFGAKAWRKPESPFTTKRKIGRAIFANSSKPLADEPHILDLIFKMNLAKELNMPVDRIDDLPALDVNAYLFIIDTQRKSSELRHG